MLIIDNQSLLTIVINHILQPFLVIKLTIDILIPKYLPPLLTIKLTVVIIRKYLPLKKVRGTETTHFPSHRGGRAHALPRHRRKGASGRGERLAAAHGIRRGWEAVGSGG